MFRLRLIQRAWKYVLQYFERIFVIEVNLVFKFEPPLGDR